MKVLVTGHLGYIGTILVPMLLERGHEVVGVDCDFFSRCTFTGSIADVPMIGADVRDFVLHDDLHERLAGFDSIIHLAALSNDPLGDYRPELTPEINTQPSIALAKAAKRAGVPRFVFASSCSNYGASGDTFIDENAEFNPVTPYGQSKVDVELAVTLLADDQFSPTFLRASTAYGVSPRIRFDLVVNNLAAWAFTTGNVQMKSDGLPWRPIVHVEDIARAYIATIEAPRELVHNAAFNVGQTSENYQVRDIAKIVHEAIPGSKLTFAADAQPDSRNYRVDCGHISRTLHGYKPQWTCRRGVEQLLEAYEAENITLEDFEGERFKRIAHIQKLISDGVLSGDLRVLAATEA